MDYSKDAILLRLSKEMQVAALHEQGFTEVTMATPLTEIAEYIKWTGGLRDLRIATVKPADGQVYYFSGEEWSALSANAKSNYEKIGVCIRARKRMFIIAPDDCVSETGGTTFKFGLRGTDLKGVKNYGANSSGLYDITTGLEDTQAAVEQGAGLTDSEGTVGAPAAEAAWSYKASTNDPCQWYLPSVAELRLIAEFKTEIHAFFDKYFAGVGKFQNTWYWSSTEYDSSVSWFVYMNGGYRGSYHRGIAYRVRPVAVVSSVAVSSANQPVIYDIPFSSIVAAFEDCCKQKMSATDCQRFFCQYQQELVRLWQDLRTGCYAPGTSKCFVVKWPVFREVFAADFADRIIHHWWALRVNPLYEERFQAQGNVSKNCRKGEGTLSAVKAAQAMVNEHPDWWVGKFDFEGFFMSMDQELLLEMTDLFIRDHYQGDDLECLLYINRIVITHSPQYNCIRRSPIELWDKIPPRKTLFGQSPGKGCAIGNLPSQLNANFLGSVFDHWITKVIGVSCYVRFVDDFIILMPTRDEIVQLVPQLRDFLTEQLLIKLHPKKIYIQPVMHGFLFVGAYIHVGRSYISNRTRGKMYDCIRKFNQLAAAGKAEEHVEKFVASLNSYLGMMVHHNSYKIRRSVMGMLHKEWWRYIMFEGHFTKVILKKKFKPREKLKKVVRSGEYQKLLTPELE